MENKFDPMKISRTLSSEHLSVRVCFPGAVSLSPPGKGWTAMVYPCNSPSLCHSSTHTPSF